MKEGILALRAICWSIFERFRSEKIKLELGSIQSLYLPCEGFLKWRNGYFQSMRWTAHDRHLANPRRWCKYGNSGKSRGKHNAWHSHLSPPPTRSFPQIFLLTVWPAGDFGFGSHLLNLIFIILIGERTRRSGVGEKSKATNPRKDDNFKWVKSKLQKEIF